MKQLTLGQLEEAIKDLKETVELFDLAGYKMANGITVQVELTGGKYELKTLDSIEKLNSYVSKYHTTTLGSYDTFAEVEGRLFELYA